MATTDPAVAAAMRAWRAHPDSDLAEDWEFDYSGSEERIAAAREALAPIRELHKPITKRILGGPRPVCAHCWDPAPYLHGIWPCATALLVYTSEELQ